MSTTLAALFAAQAITLGAHVGSVHVPAREYQHNVNPGLYLRVHGGPVDGLTLGAYRNTLGRRSVYLAHTSSWATGTAIGSVDLTLGVISGYQRRCSSIRHQIQTPLGPHGSRVTTWRETTCYGTSPGALAPLVAPSITLPFAVLSLTPRVTLLVNPRDHGTALHLSVERGF